MNKLRIPNQVNVSGIHYDVKETPVCIINGDARYCGLCAYEEPEIQILESLSGQRKFETFFHELLHAMMYEAGLKEHDEELVEKLGKALYQVMKENNFYEEDELDGQA